MRRVWKWFNCVSTYIGWGYFAAQGVSWIGCSIHAGHTLGYWEFHRLCDEAFMQVADWLGSHAG
jgi:hypothetical protein